MDKLFSATQSMENGQKTPYIDIEAVIRSKNPGLLRWIPGFVLRYIKRIIHQDHINDFIRRHGDKQSHAFVDEVINEFGVNVTFDGLEHIPAEGGFIIAANHPIGGLDGMALIHVIAKKRRDQKFIVNDVLLNISNLSDIFIGVNKHGKNPVATLDLIDYWYKSDIAMLIFPAGLVSRKQKGGIIRDLAWKKSFITKGKKFNRAVIPVHISGRNSDFFYNLARWRTRLGIKANIEMFYLMDEMYHQLGKNIHVRIGAPITPNTFQPHLSDQEWAEKVKAHVYELAERHTTFDAADHAHR